MKLKFRVIVSLLLAVMILGLFAGCNKDSKTDGNDEESQKPAKSSQKAPTEKETEKKPEMVTVFVDSKDAEDGNSKKLREDFTARTGIEIKLNVLPGVGQEAYKKLDIVLLSGDETDIVFLNQPVIQHKYASTGLLMGLNQLFKDKKYDAEKIYGKFLKKYDGEIFYLPNGATVWAVFYNKKIFDEAKVPYPEGEWTWAEYIETAKKVTDHEKGIYGSNMFNWDYYLYMIARQKNVTGYKADGTSNFDAPEYKESLKFYKELSSVHKVQPSWLDYSSKKYAWNEFVNGKMAMQYFGTWFVNILNDTETYPRDFDYGIVQPPANPGAKNNVGVSGAYGINKNTENPDAAFEYLKFVVENWYKYFGSPPARVDLPDDEMDKVIKTIAEKSGGSITVEDYKKAVIDNDLGFVDEKIVGEAAAQYSSVIKQEGERYLVGEIGLDEAVKNIKNKVDEAIKTEREQSEE